MELPENILKEVRQSFSSKKLYEKESVDAYIQELMMQVADAKKAADSKQKEISEYKKKVKELEESRMLDGDHTDTINNLNSKLKKANSDISAVKAKLSDMESRAYEAEHKLQEANDKIEELTEECSKYDKALSEMQEAGEGKALPPSVAVDDDQIAQLKEELQEREDTIEANEQQIKELEKALADAKRQKEAAPQDDSEELKKQAASLKAELAKEKEAAENVRKELEEAKKRIRTLETDFEQTASSGNAEIDPVNLFSEAQQFLNAAKEKAAALTENAEKQAEQLLQDARAEAEKIRETVSQEAVQKADSDLTALSDLVLSARSSIMQKLEEASAAAESARKLATEFGNKTPEQKD